MNCKNCNFNNDEKNVYCSECGYRLDGKQKCHNCGTVFAGNYCFNCGKKAVPVFSVDMFGEKRVSVNNTSESVVYGQNGQKVLNGEQLKYKTRTVVQNVFAYISLGFLILIALFLSVPYKNAMTGKYEDRSIFIAMFDLFNDFSLKNVLVFLVGFCNTALTALFTVLLILNVVKHYKKGEKYVIKNELLVIVLSNFASLAILENLFTYQLVNVSNMTASVVNAVSTNPVFGVLYFIADSCFIVSAIIALTMEKQNRGAFSYVILAFSYALTSLSSINAMSMSINIIRGGQSSSTSASAMSFLYYYLKIIEPYVSFIGIETLKTVLSVICVVDVLIILLSVLYFCTEFYKQAKVLQVINLSVLIFLNILNIILFSSQQESIYKLYLNSQFDFMTMVLVVTYVVGIVIDLTLLIMVLIRKRKKNNLA